MVKVHFSLLLSITRTYSHLISLAMGSIMAGYSCRIYNIRIFSWLLTPLRNKIPDTCSTVKDLIPYITTRSIKVWEKDEVYEEIKNLIVEMFYINPVLITPDSHIIDDLGLA